MAYRVVITKAGGPNVLDIQEIAIPEPQPNEVCIQVHFAGINFADTLMRMGFYQPRPPFPFTPGYEVSGIIHSIGKDVQGFEIGQRVVGLMRTGGQASHVVADASRTLPIPDETPVMTTFFTMAFDFFSIKRYCKCYDLNMDHFVISSSNCLHYRFTHGRVGVNCF